MPNSSWRKRFAVLKNRLYLYPAPEPMPRTRLFWIALGLVAGLAAAFSVFYILYLTRMQDAFMTPAEDMGIMDQAVWSITHGQLLHQTICNIVNDTNCYGLGGFPRFAIHFEPILFPISILYFVRPDPKALMVIQTLVVASGAFPAFWLARLRLRSELAAVGIAALYLLYPELQQAEAGYFHAVVMTAAFLLFMLYFMYTRRTLWVFVFALLAMACKEEIPLIIFLLGLWSLLFQQRWRTGLGLAGMAVAWVGLVLLMFHLFSPTGRPLLASRYAYLGGTIFDIVRNVLLHPVTLLKQHVFEHAHIYYIRLLFSPVNYLSLLAPWVLILILPSLALNLFSSDPNMYQGTGQYNAEIVPFLVFATIEALVLILCVIQWATERVQAARRQRVSAEAAQRAHAGRTLIRLKAGNPRWLQPAVLLLLLAFTLLSVLRHDQTYGVMPISQGFIWPQVTAHDQMAQRFINLIPPDASVSAQSSLVPHLSHRTSIYLFPYGVDHAEYIFLDVTSDRYPLAPADYQHMVQNLLLHGNYGIIASGDGYLLLKHGLPAPGQSPQSPATSGTDAFPQLPQDFCSFVRVPPQPGTTPVQVDFTSGQGKGSAELVAFQVKRPGAFLQVIAYWKASQQLPPLKISTSLWNAAGEQVFESSDFTGATWCPSSTWQPGTIVQMSTSLLYVGDVPRGSVHLTLALLPYGVASATMNGDGQGLPFVIRRAPAAVTAGPGKNVLQLQTFRL